MLICFVLSFCIFLLSLVVNKDEVDCGADVVFASGQSVAAAAAAADFELLTETAWMAVSRALAARRCGEFTTCVVDDGSLSRLLDWPAGPGVRAAAPATVPSARPSCFLSHRWPYASSHNHTPNHTVTEHALARSNGASAHSVSGPRSRLSPPRRHTVTKSLFVRIRRGERETGFILCGSQRLD